MKYNYWLIILTCVMLVILSNLKEPAATVGTDHSESAQKIIALTFDDGPHSTYTKALLDGLRERDVKVTFFLLGKNIDGNEELVKQMQADGHLIGNHGYDHVMFEKGNSDFACGEISKTNQMIYEITGSMPTYIRPPFGKWNEELECLIPMTVVLWNVDTLDWKTQNRNQIVQAVLKKVDNNNIVLMHDLFEPTVEAALEVVDILKAQGYEFVTVEELLIE